VEMKEKAARAFEELSKSNEEEMLAPQAQGEAKIQQYLTEAESFKQALQQRGYTEQVSHQNLKYTHSAYSDLTSSDEEKGTKSGWNQTRDSGSFEGVK